VTLPRLSRLDVKPLDQEQAKRLLAVAKRSPLGSLLTLALVTGMRLGELLALHRNDISFEEKTLQVRHTVVYIQRYGYVETEPKTESSRRSIALSQITVDALKQHRAAQLEIRLQVGPTWKDQGLVFTIVHVRRDVFTGTARACRFFPLGVYCRVMLFPG
jgi:integrase